ncbi:MAG: hypothetical protein RL208_141 [Pseudomonadota bacterium]|jgi:hypothetical protein
MKRLSLLLFTTSLYSAEVFALNECSSSPAYVEMCNLPKIFDAVNCVVKNKKYFEAGVDIRNGFCVTKAEDLLAKCSPSQINTCDTPENASSNLFEVCLSKYTDSCGVVGKKYS